MNATYISAGSQKVLIYISLMLAVIYGIAFVYLLDFFPPPPPTLSHDQVVALYSHANLKFRAGVVLMILSGAFFLPWSLVIAVQMARLERGLPIWAILEALASTIGTWLLAFPPVFWGIAAFSVDRDSGLTVLMHELAWLIFTSPVSFWPFQLFSISVVAFTARTDVEHPGIPRWAGWFTAWTALGGVLGVMSQVFKTGPFAWNGLFSFYCPVLFVGIWMATMAVTLLRAIGQQQRAATTGNPHR